MELSVSILYFSMGEEETCFPGFAGGKFFISLFINREIYN